MKNCVYPCLSQIFLWLRFVMPCSFWNFKEFCKLFPHNSQKLRTLNRIVLCSEEIKSYNTFFTEWRICWCSKRDWLGMTWKALCFRCVFMLLFLLFSFLSFFLYFFIDLQPQLNVCIFTVLLSCSIGSLESMLSFNNYNNVLNVKQHKVTFVSLQHPLPISDW